MIRELWHTRRTLLGALVLTIAAPLTVADEQGKGAQSYYYEDIARFFAAYERFLGSGEETAFADYLERGTKGLKNFADQFSLSPEYLAKTVQKYPAFFSSIRDAAANTRGKRSGSISPGVRVVDVQAGTRCTGDFDLATSPRHSSTIPICQL